MTLLIHPILLYRYFHVGSLPSFIADPGGRVARLRATSPPGPLNDIGCEILCQRRRAVSPCLSVVTKCVTRFGTVELCHEMFRPLVFSVALIDTYHTERFTSSVCKNYFLSSSYDRKHVGSYHFVQYCPKSKIRNRNRKFRIEIENLHLKSNRKFKIEIQKNRNTKLKIEIQKSQSKIEIENRNPKAKSIIRNRNPHRNPKSKIEIGNRNRKSKSKIDISEKAHTSKFKKNHNFKTAFYLAKSRT